MYLKLDNYLLLMLVVFCLNVYQKSNQSFFTGKNFDTDNLNLGTGDIILGTSDPNVGTDDINLGTANLNLSLYC